MTEKIDFDVFKRVDIRIGTVIQAEVPEWSHWVMKLKVDLGNEIGEKICFSGIMKFYKPEELVGRQFPFVVNLKPKRVGPEGEFSECMMIMAVPGEGEDVKPILFSPYKKVENGVRVY